MAQNKLANDLEQTLDSVNIEPFAPTLSPLIEETLVETQKEHYRKGTFLNKLSRIFIADFDIPLRQS